MVRVLQLALVVIVLSQAAQPDPSRAALQPRNDDERAIAKHFSRYREKLKPIQPGQITGPGPIELGPPPPPPRPNPFEELRVAVCKTDLIATGHLTPTRVIFNTGDTFLVTLYEFRIDTWLRMPVAPQRTIQVALAGGEVVLEGQRTVGLVIDTPRLDGSAMMWLKRIPGSRAYGLSTDIGILTFDGDERDIFFPTHIPLFHAKESQANVVTSIVNAAATCRGL